MSTTTPCPSPSSVRLKRKCSVVKTPRPTNTHGGGRSRFRGASTTYVVCTAASATVRSSSLKTCMRKIKICRHAGCPPAGSVVVVRDDPSPARDNPRLSRRINTGLNPSVEAGQAHSLINKLSCQNQLPRLFPLFAPCMDDSLLSSNPGRWHEARLQSCIRAQFAALAVGPTMNIHEWVPPSDARALCPWCKAGLTHHGPTVLSSN
ncbi:hypothetical protein LMG29542_08480 [Paraburkholderia humisilvae]|uniref:Uncharacterized protein n=1 Tax=Paraburkholderia humisilvae TaxID=627669 RepID=A0A6J5F855_9BURK|nr:hypothetical protein LMG29542_08480 [Paraburkholderia humisilvae]